MTAHDLPPAEIGHNREPTPVSLWHQHMWTRARAEHSDSRLPAPVIRMRMERAGELGMAYSDYASLYRTAGRDPAGLLFTPEALQLRLSRKLEMPAPVRAHLAKVKACHLLALAPEGEDPAQFLEELREVSSLPFIGAAAMPSPQAPWQMLAAVLLCALGPLRLTGTAVALIASNRSEARLCANLCTAGRLAGVLDSNASFRPA
jgi:hypothetical protein